MNENNMDTYRTPEEAHVSSGIATHEDLGKIENFLGRPEISSLFTPHLDDPVRKITIKERVQKKYRDGIWVIANHNNMVIGCMAVVPCNIPVEVPKPDLELKISEGISIARWQVKKIMELSTVVVDPYIKSNFKIKGVGTTLLSECRKWISNKGKGNWGFITDSWIGGDMDGFLKVTNSKLIKQDHHLEIPEIDTLLRIYSDPQKRGVSGPPTVIYGIPITSTDLNFFTLNQREISLLRVKYNQIKAILQIKNK